MTFIKVVGDKFVMSIKQEKITYSFCKKLRRCKISSITYISNNKISNKRLLKSFLQNKIVIFVHLFFKHNF